VHFCQAYQCWHPHILRRSFYFILDCIRLPEKQHPAVLWLTGTSTLRFFAGLKTVVSMCRSYGTFSQAMGCRTPIRQKKMGCRTPIRQMPSGILF